MQEQKYKEEKTWKLFYRQTDRHISSVLPHNSKASFGREGDWIWDRLFSFYGEALPSLSLSLSPPKPLCWYSCYLFPCLV